LSTKFNDFFEALQDDNFEEKPVDVKTFVESPEYLGQPPLSDIQYDIVNAMSQVYKKEDLQKMMGAEEGILQDILENLLAMLLILLTLLLTLNRLRMFSLKVLKPRLSVHHGLLENMIQK